MAMFKTSSEENKYKAGDKVYIKWEDRFGVVVGKCGHYYEVKFEDGTKGSYIEVEME